MTDRSRARRRTTRFSPYLLAVALAPAFLQTNTPLSCSGDNTLSELEMFAQGENQIVGFNPNQRSYDVSLPLGTDEVRLRAVAADRGARVWVDLFVDGEQFGYQDYGSSQGYGVGGTDVVVPIPAGPSVVRAWVSPPGGQTAFYDVRVESGSEGSAYVAGSPVTVSGLSPLADCPSDAAYTHAEMEPWIAVNPANRDNMVGAWMQDAAPVTRGHVAGVTFDGGATWESVVIPGLSRCSGGDLESTSDPWLAFTTNGNLYSAALSHANPDAPGPSAIRVNKSVDGGLTWSDPITISRVDPPALDDKESITADPEDPCTVYVTWTRFKDLPAGGSFPALLLLSRTTDCGDSWTEPRVIADTAVWRLGLQILVMPDGGLRAFSAGPGTLSVQHSTDQGDTWSEAVVVANLRRERPLTPDGSARVRSGSILFDVAVDRDTGYLYAVWEQLFAPGLFPVQVAFASSTDGGLTWSAPIRIDQTPSSGSPLLGQAFMPSVEVADDGTVGATYYNFQNADLGESTSLTDYWFVHCNPMEADCADESGWGGNALRLTQSSFDYLLAPVFRETLFLGDYMGLTASGNDFFALFSVTTDDDPANAVFVPIRTR